MCAAIPIVKNIMGEGVGTEQSSCDDDCGGGGGRGGTGRDGVEEEVESIEYELIAYMENDCR